MFTELTNTTALEYFPEIEKILEGKAIHVKLILTKNHLEVTPETVPDEIISRTERVYYNEKFLGSYCYIRYIKDKPCWFSIDFDHGLPFMYFFNRINNTEDKYFFLINPGQLFFLHIGTSRNWLYIITLQGPGNQEKFELGYNIDWHCPMSKVRTREKEGLPKRIDSEPDESLMFMTK